MTPLDEQSFKYLFQALVRPHIEYPEAVWSPFKVGDIEKIESVQRSATKQVPMFFSNLSFLNVTSFYLSQLYPFFLFPHINIYICF
jgi:hypothetical protein